MTKMPAYYQNAAGVTLETGETYIWDQNDASASATAAGIVYTYIDWNENDTLMASIQNVTLNNANQRIVGNASDNIITAGTGNETMSGGGGNDVFVAASDTTSSDTFVLKSTDSGSDTIIGFNAALDSVVLSDFANFKTFSDITANMQQVGANTILTLGNGSTLTITNTNIATFNATNLALPGNVAGLAKTFDDEFNSFSGSPTGADTTWQEDLTYGNRTLASNNEAEYYDDANDVVNPFTLKNGVLSITAQQGTNPLNLPWISGEINTYSTFAQEYGIFEVRAELPAGQGMWPAFWMLPADGSWPPELDIFEALGDDPNTVYSGDHSAITSGAATAISTANDSTGFHTYAVDWEPNTITFCIDGNAVAVDSTPADMNVPMYMELDLAVGGSGSWPGATDSTTPATDAMQIDYVRAYATANTVGVSGNAAVMQYTTPPAVAIGSSVLAQDTGISATDRVTTDGAITVSGTVEVRPGIVVAIMDGMTFLGDATLDGIGAWTYITTLALGTHLLDAVATDLSGNSATTAIQAPIVVKAPDRLVLNVSEDAYLGDAQFLVTVDGRAVGGVQTITALRNAGQGQAITLTGDFGAGYHLIGLQFLNDTYGGSPDKDRNMYVNSIALNGVTTTVNAVEEQDGTGYYEAQGLSTAPVMTPPAFFQSPTTDTLVLNVAEDAYLGNVQFAVSVDGKMLAGTQTVTALEAQSQSQTITLTGQFGSGSHTVGINFLNDRYGGSTTTDRNLYVNSITIDGTSSVENNVQPGDGSIQYISGNVSAVSGTSGNDTLMGTTATNLLAGNGGNDTYVVGATDQLDTIVNGDGTQIGASGQLLESSASNHLWFVKSGNDLVIDVLGATQQTVIKNWYAGAQPLSEILSADNLKLDSGLAQLVQAMATFSAANTAFDPAATSQTNLSSSAFGSLAASVANAWHH